MTTSNELTRNKLPRPEGLIEELKRLLCRVSFTAERGSYVQGKLVCVLVDTEPGDVPGTFHAGLIVFPLTDEQVDMAGIGIAMTGQVEGQPRVLPMRPGVTNRRGSMMQKDLLAGQYRLLLSAGVVSPKEPIPLLSRAAGFATGPRNLVFQEYRAEDGSLTCILHETREGELILDFETSPATEEELWAEYSIVEQASEQVAMVARADKTVELAGRVALQPGPEGRYTARTSLGHGVDLPQGSYLRVYLMPGQSSEGKNADGDHQPS